MPKIVLDMTSESIHSHDCSSQRAALFSECTNWDAIFPSILRAILKNLAYCVLKRGNMVADGENKERNQKHLAAGYLYGKYCNLSLS